MQLDDFKSVNCNNTAIADTYDQIAILAFRVNTAEFLMRNTPAASWEGTGESHTSPAVIVRRGMCEAGSKILSNE